MTIDPRHYHQPSWRKPVGMLAIVALIALWAVLVGSLSGLGAGAGLCRARHRLDLAPAAATAACMDGNRALASGITPMCDPKAAMQSSP